MAAGAASSTAVALVRPTSRNALDRPDTALPRQNDLPVGESRRDRYRKRYDTLKNDASEVVAEFRDISEYIRPRRGVYLETVGQRQRRESRRASAKIINSAATIASRTLGSGMVSGASSRARPWFNLDIADRQLKEAAPVRDWLARSTRTIQLVLARSNAYEAIQQFDRDVGDFGNGCMIIDEDWDDVVRFTVLAPGQYFWATGPKGRVNTLYARFKYTVGTVVDEYGIDNCTKRTRDLYHSGKIDEIVDVIMAIERNMRQIPGERGIVGMPFVQVIFEEAHDKDREKDLMLRVSGYREWPVPVGRWELQTGETYAWGPGLEALGDARSLQTLERRKAQAIDKLVTPPVQAPGLSVGSDVQHMPGGVTHLPTASAANSIIRPLYEQNGQGIQAIQMEIDKVERRINEVYFADLFLMLANDQRRQPVTAREIEERHEEKLLALGPVLDRLHNEAFNVMIERVFAICVRAGLIPPAPPELQDHELRIEYTSILAQAQQAVSLSSIERTLGFVGNLAAVFPDAPDKVDAHQAIDEYASVLNVPPGIIRSDEDVDRIRQEKQAAMQQQMAMDQAPQMAQSAQVLSETPVGQSTALDTLLGVGTP